MKKKLAIKNTEAISLEMRGKFNLTIKKSGHFIGIEYDTGKNKQCDAKLVGDNCIIIIANKEEQKWNNEIKESVSNLNFKNGFLKFIESAKPLFNHLVNKKESSEITATLYVGKNTLNYLKIDADNIDLKIDFLKTEELSLNVDNISLFCESMLSADKCFIKADNTDATVYFSQKTPFWDVEADNASFRINRQGGFQGLVDIDADNIDTRGRTSGDSKVGLFKICGDNVDVYIT